MKHPPVTGGLGKGCWNKSNNMALLEDIQHSEAREYVEVFKDISNVDMRTPIPVEI